MLQSGGWMDQNKGGGSETTQNEKSDQLTTATAYGQQGDRNYEYII